MSAIGHLLEAQGLATVSISLVREHTERIQPPRALWVPFELGRPFGSPNDPDQQRRLLRSALDLLERPDGPVILQDSDELAQAVGAEQTEGLFCALPIPASTANDVAPLQAEVDSLHPWYALAKEQNTGRTTVGVSGLDIAQVVDFLRGLLDGTDSAPAPGMDLGQTLRFASEDLRNWYLEAAQAQPGPDRSAAAGANWFWGETAAGALLLELKPICVEHPDKRVRWVAQRSLIPRNQAHRLADPQ